MNRDKNSHPEVPIQTTDLRQLLLLEVEAVALQVGN